MAAQDLIKIGDLYGRWEIINLPYKKGKRWFARCKCTCGSKIEKDIRVDGLIAGHSRSCGCLQKEQAYKSCKARKKQNKYDLSGDYGIGYTNNVDPSDPTHKRNYFYFDLEDYDKIKKYCWSFACSRDYVEANNFEKKIVTILNYTALLPIVLQINK